MKYRMIQRCREAFPIRMMCRCLRVSPSGYYGWGIRPLSAAAQENARLLERIRELHVDHDGVVGSPRVWEDLRYAEERCGRHRVARLMRRAGLQGVPQRRQWRKRPAGARPSGTRNHLDRNFHAVAPNTKWVTDITYIRTAEHWLYLCVVLDVYSGLVVGWSMSPQQDRQLVVHAVLMALWQRPARTPSHSALGSGLSMYLRGIPTVPGGSPGDLQHERGGELCRQRRRRELFRGAQTRTSEPTSLPDPCRGQGRYL